MCGISFYREDREARFLASKMSIVASLRSWSGKQCRLNSVENCEAFSGILVVPDFSQHLMLIL